MTTDNKFKPRGTAVTIPAADAKITQKDIEAAVAGFAEWAKVNAPGLVGILEAEVEEDDSGKR